MEQTNNKVSVQLRKLTPGEGMHLKNINTGDIYESDIYLGAYDSVDNYVEVDEAEYQEYLAKPVEEKND